MSITRWTHDNPFIPGTVVRAGATNAKLDGIAVAIKSIIDRIEQRVPQLPANFSGNPVISEQNIQNSLLYISPAGNLTVYRLNTFTNQIEQVTHLRNETEQFRDETLAIRNQTEQLRDEASDFAVYAEQSAADSAGYRDESAYWAQEAQMIADALGTGVVFYGDWDASNNTFPEEPIIGSGMWKVSAVNASGVLGSFTNVNVGDTLIWFSVESRWILLDTRDQVVSVNGYKGTVVLDVEDLASITAYSATLLLQETSAQWRASLDVLQAGTGNAQVRNNQQLDSRYVQQDGYNAFNPSGNYGSLRARATTQSDVGLSNVRNVASYSQNESDARYSQSDTTYSAGTGISLSSTTFSLRNIQAGSSTSGTVYYNGTTRSGARWYGGNTNPNGTTRLNYNGYLYATRGYFVSSLRYKNIHKVVEPTKALDNVVALGRKGVSIGKYKGTKGKRNEHLHRWLIAEDVATVLPECVDFDEKGRPDSLDYTSLIPELYAAIYQLEKRLRDLENE